MEPGSVEDRNLTYVVMGARYRNQWIFVRHHERQTWEMPAGHIEPGESARKAAARELGEETGAVAFDLDAVCDYSVTVNNHKEFGRLYYATVREMNIQLEFEIEELLFAGELPEKLTYPDVQTLLFERVKKHLFQ